MQQPNHHNAAVLKATILQHDQPVPRYTSYPTAPQFCTDFPASLADNWLTTLPEGATLSLYVHIPFCPQLCYYCGCFTHIVARYTPITDYLPLLLREITMMGQRLGQRHTVTHLHFGGGSPTMLAAADFEQLMTTLRAQFIFAPDAEIAIEIDPRAMTPALAACYAAAGVNRVSLGVQDFDERVMVAVNRVQPYALVAAVVAMLRAVDITQFNFDFIYGLPHQTVSGLVETMRAALLLVPSRVALYGYAHVPWKKKNIRLIEPETLPDAALRYDLFNAAAAVLQEAGLQPIGIDHFAQPDDPMALAQRQNCLGRNFQGYTDIMPDALLGFGLSAISQFPQGYAQNTIDNAAYAQALIVGQMPIAKGYVFSGEDAARKEIIDRLMGNLTADAGAIWQKHEHDAGRLQQILVALTPYVADGLIVITGSQIVVDPAARMIVRLIAAAFDAYLPVATVDAAPRHAHTV